MEAPEALVYIVSKSTVIQVDANGLVATNSVSRNVVNLNWVALQVLNCFARPGTVAQAFDRLPREVSFDYPTFSDAAGKFISDNIITPISGSVPSLAAGGFGAIARHHLMLRDVKRVLTYRNAILRHARGKVVVEVGCGTGILSIFAAQAGATKVYAIEESAIANVAELLFQSNEHGQNITLIRGNSRDIQLPERAGLLIHEILGSDPFSENIIPYITDARDRFLDKQTGRLVPTAFSVCCVGIETSQTLPTLDRLLSEAHEFSGLYGVNFDRYIEMLTADYQRAPFLSNNPLVTRADGNVTPHIVSNECTLRQIDLQTSLGPDIASPVSEQLLVRRDAELGALLVFFRTILDDRFQLSTSPHTKSPSWGWSIYELSRPIHVTKGQTLTITSRVANVRGRDRLQLDVETPHRGILSAAAALSKKWRETNA